MLRDKKYISIPFSESGLRERNRDLALLLELSDLLAGSTDLTSILGQALSKTMEHFNIDAGRIYLMDNSGRQLNLLVYHGMEPKGLEHLSIDEGFSGKAARTRSFIAQHVTELEDQDRASLLISKGFKVIICVPLITMDEVKGVMNLAASRLIRIDQREIDLLTTIGYQMAVAVIISELNEGLLAQVKALEEKNEMIQFFAYSISHDLKSPAIGMYGLTRRLKDKYLDKLDEKGREICDQILKTSEKFVNLVDKINIYIQAKEAPCNLESVPSAEIIGEIGHQFSDTLKSRQVTLTVQDDLPLVVADRLSLSRVFQNFVDNSLKYGGDGLGEIKIGYRDAGEFHVFSVSDDGVGIKSEDAEKVFGVFQREETSRGKAGSGLGLAIIKEIAKRHQGEVWLEKHTDSPGVTFYISLSKKLAAG